MDNLEVEILKKEIDELKKQNDNIGMYLVLVILLLVILLLGVGFMVWKFLQFKSYF